MPGDDAFEALVQEYYAPLFRFALSLTRSEMDAGDLVQQTFYTWATKGHQLRDPSKIKTWLFTTLYREYLRVHRRQIRFPHHALEDSAEELPAVPPSGGDLSDGRTLISLLDQMDESFRAPVALFYLEEVSYKDIAGILDIPLGTVKSRIARGVAWLQRSVGSPMPGTSPRKGDPSA